MIRREDDYAAEVQLLCDYDDPAARQDLVDALAKDAMALLGVLDGRSVDGTVAQAGALLATLVGQDLDEGVDSRAAGVVEALHRAADSSPDVDALWERWPTGRRAGAAMVIGHPPLTRALAPGMGADQAVDVLWTLNNPDLHLGLVTGTGWTENAFEAWLARTMRTALLS